jgi:hypothetical protein
MNQFHDGASQVKRSASTSAALVTRCTWAVLSSPSS